MTERTNPISSTRLPGQWGAYVDLEAGPGGSSALVKRFARDEKVFRAEMERELLARELVPSRRVPPVLNFDFSTGAIEIEFIEDCESLDAILTRDLETAESLLYSAGRALAEVHSSGRDRVVRGELEDSPVRDHAVPAPAVTPTALALGPGFEYRKYLSQVQAPDVVAAYRRLYDRWSPTAFIHGDTKPDNILVTRGDDIVLLDWELCGAGDPHFDLGLLLGGVLHAWFRAIPYSETDDALDAISDPDQIRAARKALGFALAGYSSLLPPRATAPDIEMALGYAGSHLHMRALADLWLSGFITKPSWLSLAFGSRLLVHPELGVELFELTGRGAAA